MITTDIGYTTRDTIVVRNLNLSTEIIGKFDFVDMIFLLTLARSPSPQEKTMVNALLVTAADHGLTPSSVSTRMTYTGAPEAMQAAVAAVAAGLLGAGSVLLGTMQNSAEMLLEAARDLDQDADDGQVRDVARAVIRRHKQERRAIYGVGHPIHVDGDPRVPTLRALSVANGCYGVHWRVMEAIADVFDKEFGKKLPLNAVGAIGSIVADMGLDPVMARGLALVGRSAGLLAHILEERQAPVGQKIWTLVLEQDPRNVL
ncbi:citrate synthase [Cupriavidus necator]|uniref:citrate synthase (unknown stereospecificity) n=1 Tax=Cupriavidus necator (strain ATCC 17699 / DSM 428 / KCTC 22496 / NCIMB 10442 / H16 / Stanier 337) TaxID=381666 RepID=Q0K461_CUPNH|nr:citryl-CoA lyase [Cupriavidus necator]QCC03135.1 citryl-CoA lyase [Cupriavidus necator H16]QQB80192.1 citryl-CoA lyase [Cupriavidus necator]WKA44457.1 citryl-CoA lyase [Cupriavidus necator]CAJ95213.1 citrate synthase [Cupriavidus necator H16]